jgi:hypothetical protein
MQKSLLASLLIGVSAVAFSTTAEAGKKLTYSDFTLTGGVTLGYSTDRNAGAAPVGERSAADDFDDEDEDGEDGDDDIDVDAFEDLDLDDQNLLDQLNETTDEDGDGDFFDDDEDAFDIDGDGIPDEDADGDGIEDVDLDGDGEPDFDLDGDGTPDVDADGDGIEDPIADGVDADAGDGDAVAIALDGSEIPADALAAVGGGRRPAPSNIRDDRFTTRAKLGLSYKMGSWAKEWKTSAQVGTAMFNTLDRKDNFLFAMNSGPVFKVKAWDATIQPSFMFASLSTDGTHQFDNYGGSLAAQFNLNKLWQLGVRYGYDIRDFDNSLVENVDAHSYGTSLKYKLSKTQALVGGYRARFEDTDVEARGKAAHQVTLGYQQKWQNGVYIRPQVGYAYIERNGAARAGQPVREDRRTTFNMALGKTFDYGINVEAQYSNMDTDVNLPRKDVANDRFVILSGWKF